MSTTQPKAETGTEKKMEPVRRNALLRYMVVLFVVAFAVVALSLLVQMRNSKDTILALNQTSANALQNAEHLQEQNQTLSKENDELQRQLSQAEEDQEDLNEQLQQVQEELASEKETQQAAQKRQQASELLIRACLAKENEDQEDYEAAMAELAPLQDSLDQAGAELYRRLLKE